MRVLVDLNRCQAYAQCCFLAPDVFELKGREVLFYRSEVSGTQRMEVRRAAAACPVQAILVDELLVDDEPSSPGGRAAR